MRLYGLGGLGLSDTDTLSAGTLVSFDVYGGSCSGVYEKDIRDGLNNWLSSMMTIDSVTTNPMGYIPTQVDVSVTATVTSDIPAGELRGQIIAALDGLSHGVSSLNCGGVSLKNNVLNAAPGGTNPPAPPGANPFGINPTTLMLIGAVLGLVIVSRK